jgi:hypothetical protein
VAKSKWILSSLLVLSALSLCACATTAGVVQGYVVVPEPNQPTTGITRSEPSRLPATVMVKANGRVRGTQQVSPGHRFRFTLPPGTYFVETRLEGSQATSAKHLVCTTTQATISSGQTTTVDTHCEPPP